MQPEIHFWRPTNNTSDYKKLSKGGVGYLGRQFLLMWCLSCMSLLLKYSFHWSKASCARKKGSSFRSTFPREGLPLCSRSASIMGNTVKPLYSYSLWNEEFYRCLHCKISQIALGSGICIIIFSIMRTFPL